MTRALLPTFLVLLLTLSAVSPALADDDSLHVVVLLPDKTLTYGEDANVEVHIFDAGEPSGASSVTAHSIKDPFGGQTSEVALTEKSTGVFQGTTEATNTGGIFAGTYVTAQATKEDNAASGGVMGFPEGGDTSDRWGVFLAPAEGQGMEVKPGDRIEVLIYTTKNGEPKDAPAGSLKVNTWFDSGDIDDEDNQGLNAAKVETGVYSATTTVPADRVHAGTVKINADLDVDGKDQGTSNLDFAMRFFNIWFHRQQVSTTEATFTMIVSDPDGKAVDGATIELSYDYETSTFGYESESAGSTTTDVSGQAPFTISYSKVLETVEVSGKVTLGGKSQEFSGSMVVTSAGPGEFTPEEPSLEDFDIIALFDATKALPQGKKSNLEYKAYRCKTPGQWSGCDEVEGYGNAKVYVYIHTRQKMLGAIELTTGADGKLTVPFDAPKSDNLDSATIEFDSPLRDAAIGESDGTNDGKLWGKDSENVVFGPSDSGQTIDKLVDPALRVTTSTWVVGGRNTATVHLPVASGDIWTVGLFFVPGDFDFRDMPLGSDDSMVSQAEWQPWSAMAGQVGILTKADSSLSTSLVVPHGLPASGTYTILVLAINMAELSGSFAFLNPAFDLGDFMKVSIVHVKVGQKGSSSTGQPDGNPFFGGSSGLGSVGGVDLLLLIVVVVAIVATLGVVMLLRKRRATPPQVQGPPPGAFAPTPGYPSTGAPAAQQGYQQPPPQQGYQPPQQQYDPYAQPPQQQGYQQPQQQYDPYAQPPQQGYQQPQQHPDPAMQGPPGHDPYAPPPAAGDPFGSRRANDPLGPWPPQ